ncbi:MAG TPA: sugar ABC transporter ATP-binding protein [Gaiellaceae bacterium]|nr:sugar ABC transporter ATP-binding protein [Gaiellaceae bacterium]
MPGQTAPLLRITGMTKWFPGTLALDDVDLVVERGTIHGLVGENGAGKSTLLKILAGDYRPTAGRIEIEGHEVEVSTPRRAHELGIGIVYQELSLLTNLSVAHNISLGSEPSTSLAVDERRLAEIASRALARMGVTTIDPAQKVGKIPLAERQLVEIARVLTLRQPRILIFDEPTAALGQADVDRLFRIMQALRDDGIGIIFVSHRYREVLRICDRATVMRNGRVVGEVERGETSVEHLVELTLGQKAAAAFHRTWRAGGELEPLLELRGLHVGVRVRGVDLVVRRGEIVSVCGLLGSGQNELARAVAGDVHDVSGEILVKGRAVAARSPREALGHGIALITENRQEEGLFPDMRVRANISVSSLGRVVVSPLLRVIDARKERRIASAVAQRTGIAPRALSRHIRVLSGGNQQKSLLARWLMRCAEVLVLIEPTRGVDVGAKLEIYRELEQLAQAGAGILVVSTDIPETMAVSDRIVVLHQGRVAGVLDPRSSAEQDVLLAMQGGSARAPEAVG